jgi:hypothetical protein
MLTIITIEDEKIWLMGIHASASSGNVLPGVPQSYSDDEIRDWCNENLAAPDNAPDYDGFEIER